MSLRHLTDIRSMPEDAFLAVLNRSLVMRDMMDRGSWPAPALATRLQANIFYETSTRTLMSFDIAAKRLGALTVTLPIAASSVQKGESLEDTVLTLGAQGTDYLVLRATEPETISRAVAAIEGDGFPTSVINAGEGALGHPTQGLLDVSSILLSLDRRAEDGLEDITVAICGDVRHSRVAASAISALSRLGATIRLGGPPDLLPEEKPEGVSSMVHDIAEVVEGVDFAMTLRLQVERMTEALSLNTEEYHAAYALTHDRMSAAKPGYRVMHPGPMNRNVEITEELADDSDRSLIRSQVRQGVALRMALLEHIERGKTR